MVDLLPICKLRDVGSVIFGVELLFCARLPDLWLPSPAAVLFTNTVSVGGHAEVQQWVGVGGGAGVGTLKWTHN